MYGADDGDKIILLILKAKEQGYPLLFFALFGLEAYSSTKTVGAYLWVVSESIV